MIKAIKISAVFAFASLLIGCCTRSQAQQNKNSDSDIQSVTYTYSAGRTGQAKIEILPNSLKTEMISVRFNDLNDVERALSSEEWKNLVTSINIKTVEKTPNGKMEGYMDKAEEVFEIATSTNIYRIENADSNAPEYKQLQKLKNLLYSYIKAKK